MKIKFVLTSLLAAAAIAFAGIAGAASQELASSSVLEEIKKRGSLRVGMSTFVPWAMRDKQGNLVGFEIDVATKVAEDMERKDRIRADCLVWNHPSLARTEVSTSSSVVCPLLPVEI